MVAQSVVQLFFNPASGSFCPLRLNALASALRAEGADVIATPSIDAVPVVADRATHVCIAGGDGTVRHVAANMARTGRMLPAAIYPAGTVNLLAREGGFQRSPGACARDLLHGREDQPFHPVALDETMFFACASAGPDSAAVARLSKALKRRIGRLAYVAAFCEVLWRWPRPRLRLVADGGREIACEAVYIAKGRYFAGPWSFAPRASVTDRLLHVVALPRARRRDYLGFLRTLLTGRDPARDRRLVSFTCTRLAIHNDEGFPLQADGDIVATRSVELAIRSAPILFR